MTYSSNQPALQPNDQRYTFQSCPPTHSRHLWGYVMASTTLSVTVDDTVLAKIDELASASNRDRQRILQCAVERYLEAELNSLRELDEGIADAEAGRLTDLETVKSEWLARANDSAN